MEEKPAILLIHGACHGSWCWQRLTPMLESRGFEVHAVDLPGRHPSPAWGWGTKLGDQAKAVAAKAEAIGRPVVALAHSMGGMSMSAAAELEPTLFNRLIYLSAYIPGNGDNLITLGARDKASRVNEASRVATLRGFISINPKTSPSVFYEDCCQDQVNWANGLLVREPLRPAFGKVSLTDRFAAKPRSYIRCLQDRVVTLAFQDEMISAWPCDKVASLKASHSPFLSMPGELAEAIQAVA
jgi:pimeloyl-ACP methyl ester carboxylesterase